MKAWELRELIAGADPDALVVNSSGRELVSVEVRMFDTGAGQFPAVVFDGVSSSEVVKQLQAIASRLDDLGVDVDLAKDEIRDLLEGDES